MSKAGNVVTHLGNAKGVDMNKANEASARARKEKARNDKNNRIIWGIIGQGGIPTADDTRQMSMQLNRMGVNTSTGLQFTPERVRSTYHNLKRLFA